jgi:protoporphyrinogen oxidase
VDGPRGHFLHPAGGLGVVWERAAAVVRGHGGALRFGEPVSAITAEGRRVTGVRTASGHTPADAVVATMPLGRLVGALPGAPATALTAARTLRARHTALVFLRARATRPPPHAWVHLYDPAVRAGRVTNFAAWDARRGGGDPVFALEYWCDPDDAVWSLTDDGLAALAERELAASGLAGRVTVLDAHVERLRGTHPVPHLGYQAEVDAARVFCGGFTGLAVAGRHGTFAVDSVAGAMAAGLDAAEKMGVKGVNRPLRDEI